MSRLYDALKKAEDEKRQGQSEAGKNTTGEKVTAVRASLSKAIEAAGVHATPMVETAPVQAPQAGQVTVKAEDVSVPASGVAHKKPAAREEKKENQRVRIFASDGSELLGAEEFRRLRTKLQHAREKQHLKTLVVTSAMPGEGKTFITVNLAQTITMQQRTRVLVIDADFRKPQVHAQLQVSNEIGLSDYLEGRCEVQQAIKRMPGTTLDYIVGGPVSSRPAELAGSARFEELLKTVADEYEWVLVDSPPVLPVTDAAVIAKFCDGALLVVAAGQTPGDLAQAAQKELQEANLVGVVLNRATHASSYQRYHYYHYAYGDKQAKAVSAR